MQYEPEDNIDESGIKADPEDPQPKLSFTLQ